MFFIDQQQRKLFLDNSILDRGLIKNKYEAEAYIGDLKQSCI